MPKRLLFLSASLLLLSLACRRSPDYRDFVAFYERFHADSVFQKAHVQFPLAGLPDNADSTLLRNGHFQWEAATWKIHRSIDFSGGEFTRQIQTLGDGLIIERILHRSARFAMERRFARINDEWMLIYYAGLNPIEEGR